MTAATPMVLGMVGLGRMGANLVRRLLRAAGPGQGPWPYPARASPELAALRKRNTRQPRQAHGMGEIGGKPGDAVAVLYGRYQSALPQVAAGYVGSRSVAEDMVQDALLGAIAGLPRFNERSSLKTWALHRARAEIRACLDPYLMPERT